MAKRFICSKMFTDVNIKIPNSIIKNCCKSRDFLISEDEMKSSNLILENSEYIRRKTSMVRDNELPSQGCDTCLRTEDNHFFNLWNEWDIQDYDAERDEKLITEDNFTTFEFMLSSVCDLKCIYCHPKDSSSWAKELGVPMHEGDENWKNTILSQLYELLEKKQFQDDTTYYFFFSGGEPTYNPETLVMIEKILDIVHSKTDNPVIVISTNANTKPKVLDKYIDLVRKYNNIQWIFDCSIDGVGEICEAIRYGIQWGRAIENIERLIVEPNVKIRISPTLNLYSVPTLEEFFSFFIDLFERHGQLAEDNFNTNMAQEMAMTPAFLPKEYKKYFNSSIKICEEMGVKKIHKHLIRVQSMVGTKHNDENKEKVRAQFEYFKQKRPDTDWERLFPHVVKLIGE